MLLENFECVATTIRPSLCWRREGWRMEEDASKCYCSIYIQPTKKDSICLLDQMSYTLSDVANYRCEKICYAVVICIYNSYMLEDGCWNMLMLLVSDLSYKPQHHRRSLYRRQQATSTPSQASTSTSYYTVAAILQLEYYYLLYQHNIVFILVVYSRPAGQSLDVSLY